jgi:DNA-directed RNA polymerase specialized sigma24 family protein
VQETFIKAVRHLNSLRDDGRFTVKLFELLKGWRC